MDLPEHNSAYARLDYWNERFKNEETFEWCKKYEDFKHLLDEILNPDDKILILGCGNSELSEDLYNDGYHDITNMDYSEVLIEKMSKKSSVCQQMNWVVMDITEMTFPDDSFDVIIEKATLDSLLVNEKNPWQLSLESNQLLETILKKVSKMLRKNGRFISITFTQPHFRRKVYCRTEYNWSFESKFFGSVFHFYFYIMKKGESLDESYIAKDTLQNNCNASSNHVELADDSEDFLDAMLL